MSYILQKDAAISQGGPAQNIYRRRSRASNPRAADRSMARGNPVSSEGGLPSTGSSFHKVFQKKSREIGSAGSETFTPKMQAKEWITHTVKKGDTLWALAVKKYHVNLNDLIRDNGIEDPRKLQPGQELRVRVNRYPTEETDVVASWYGEPYHGRPMANGEIYNMYAATVAHPTLPLGTQVELKNPETGVKAKAVITDRGPFIQGREVDLSYGLAKKLSFVEKGVGKLLMRILGRAEAPARSGAVSRPETPGHQGA